MKKVVKAAAAGWRPSHTASTETMDHQQKTVDSEEKSDSTEVRPSGGSVMKRTAVSTKRAAKKEGPTESCSLA